MTPRRTAIPCISAGRCRVSRSWCAPLAKRLTPCIPKELRIVQQSTMDHLLSQLTTHLPLAKAPPSQIQSAAIAHRARDYLHAHMGDNIGLSDLARETGTDRLR